MFIFQYLYEHKPLVELANFKLTGWNLTTSPTCHGGLFFLTSHSPCFTLLMEVTRFAHQMNCFTGHVKYSLILQKKNRKGKTSQNIPIFVPRGRAPSGQHQESRPLGRSNTGSPRFTDFPSLCACSESSLINLIGWEYEMITLRILWKLDLSRGADQKECGLWGRECTWHRAE